MVMQAHDAEAALIESVCARVRERVTGRGRRQGRGVRPPVLPPRARGGPARARPARPLRRRARALDFARRREPGEPNVRVYNPDFEQHGWQSTHTVVEIVTDDMPFLVDSMSMELNRQDVGHPPAHPPGDARPARRERRARGGRRAATPRPRTASSPSRSSTSRSTAERAGRSSRRCARAARTCWRRSAPPSRTGRRCASAPRELIAELDAAAAGARRGGVRRGARAARVDRRRPLHVPRLPRVRAGARDGDEDVLRPVAGTGLGILRDAAAHAARLRRSCPRACARSRASRSCSSSRRPTRARPSTARRTSTTSASSASARTARSSASGASSASTRRPRTARPRSEIPVVRRKVEAVIERAGVPARQPRREGAGGDPRHLPARRAVPDPRGRAVRDRDGDPRPRRAPARAAVRAPRPLRALRLLPGLPAARPLPHAATASASRRSCARRSTPRASTSSCGCRSPCSCASTSSCAPAAGAAAGLRRGRDRGADRRGDARVDRRARATRCSRSSARRPGTALFRRYGRRVPDRLPRRLARALGGRRHPADRGSWRDGDALGMSLYRPLEAPAGALRCKLYRRGEPCIAVRRAADVREHGAARCATSARYEVTPRDGPPTWIYDFGLERRRRRRARRRRGPRALPGRASRGVWHGELESDGFNALVLRRRPRPARRHGPARGRPLPAPGGHRVQRALHGARAARPPRRRGRPAGAVPRALRPGARAPRRGGGRDARAEIEEAIDAVDEPRRGPHPAQLPAPSCGAMLRTNHFQPAADGRPKPYLSFKLDPSRDPDPARCRARASRSSSTRRASRACTCAAAASPAAACAGRTGARTSAPRSSA